MKAEISVNELRLWLCAMAMVLVAGLALPVSAAAGEPWPNEDSMRNSPYGPGRDTFVYDPGPGDTISRSEFVGSTLKNYYVKNWNFDANFLTWAPVDKLNLKSSNWAGCEHAHAGACPAEWVHFAPVGNAVTTGEITVLHWKGPFISTVCGNFSKGGGAGPIPHVTGVKYEDMNANGKRDPGDPGLSGWTIRLIYGGKVVATTTTAGDGSYSFALNANKLPISAGTFRVEEVLKAGWVAAQTPGSFNVPFGAEDKTFAHKDFGNYRPAEIAGHKYDDSNVNGERDVGEVGLEGWKISLSNGEHDSTDSGGAYSFSVRPGTYTVGEQLKEGWRQTDPLEPNTRTYTVVSGQVVDDADFGNVCLGSTSISVVDDSTGEPVPMEIRLEEVSVPELIPNEPSLPRTMTAASMTFGELLPGTYRVVAFLPKDFYTTDPDVQPVETGFAIVKEVTVLECKDTHLELHLVSESTPGIVTGGIEIDRPGDGFATAGFVFMAKPQEPPEPPQARGVLQYNDHKGEEEFVLHTKIIKLIAIEGNKVDVWGEVEVGEALEIFHLVLVDAGEPGTDDRFELTLANGYEAGHDETLIGGNVQIHPPETPEA